MTHTTWDYPTLLRQRGFRVTPQRQLILDVICASGAPATPDDIYRQVHRRAPHLNRATVYRNLDFLCAMRLITRATVGAKRVVYELATPACPHHHLICRQCQHSVQVEHAKLKACLAHLEREYAFSLDTHHLVLYGLCQQCQAQADQA